MHIYMHRCFNMGKKARTTLTIDADVLKKAHELGLNVSQFCENALKHGINALESTVYHNYAKKGGIGTVGSESGSPGVTRPQGLIYTNSPFFIQWLTRMLVL